MSDTNVIHDFQWNNFAFSIWKRQNELLTLNTFAFKFNQCWTEIKLIRFYLTSVILATINSKENRYIPSADMVDYRKKYCIPKIHDCMHYCILTCLEFYSITVNVKIVRSVSEFIWLVWHIYASLCQCWFSICIGLVDTMWMAMCCWTEIEPHCHLLIIWIIIIIVISFTFHL